MKTVTICLFAILTSSAILAQQPGILQILNEEAEIRLESLEIEIVVIGNIARTTAKMTFYNPNDRVLEGELRFPLADNQNVYRFAMDVNGKLREGVVVEKNLGQKAFEGVVRQIIDPGLLEKTTGNNYKARVYPIPAKGRKSVLIGYEEELNTKLPVYQFVSSFGTVENFRIRVEVSNQELSPNLLNNDLVNFQFEKWRSSYIAEKKLHNFLADGILSFEIPATDSERVFREASTNGEDYFYLLTDIESINKEKPKPASIAVLWDASKSLFDRNIELELELLQNYLEHLSEVKVHFLSFSNQLHQTKELEIVNGKSDRLLKEIKKITYDGGTSYSSIPFSTVNADEILFFTDGLPNLDKLIHLPISKPTYIISSSTSNDANYSKNLAEKNGGSFINLLSTPYSEAFKILTTTPHYFLGAEYDSLFIKELYPNTPTLIQEYQGFSVAGLIQSGIEGKVTLNFGSGGNITERKEIIISRSSNNSGVKRLWANKKITAQLSNPDHKKEEIIAFAKEHQIITQYTSLIVLDRIEDYVRYEIEPPGELKAEYEELLSKKPEEIPLSKKKIIERALQDFDQSISWWKQEKKDSKTESPPNRTVSDQSRFRRSVETIDTTIFNQTVTGRIIDTDGEVVPGANIVIKGTSVGTSSNENGFYGINARPNDYLVVTFIGYQTKEVLVNDTFNGEIILDFGVVSSNELVVSGYSPIARRELTGSIVEARVASETTDLYLDRDSIEEYSEANSSLSIITESWNENEPYIEALKKTSKKNRYREYLSLRENYGSAPSFYLSVGTFFLEENETEIGLKVLSNLAELNIENHELLKTLANKYQELGEFEKSIFLLKKILNIRSFEPQSKRDLALAYEANKEYQKAVDLLYEIITHDWDMATTPPQFKTTVLHEMNSIIARIDTLDLSEIDLELIVHLPVDIRIILTWNVMDTDLDLWVTEPNGEKCSYNNLLTKLGGKLTYDNTSGYGPEEYLLKKASPGEYKVEVDFFDDRVQKVSGPISLQVAIYTNYGSKNQQVKKFTRQLKEPKDIIEIGSIVWE
ncbi:MAG: DUF2135 domain-containing protein [Balneola sp.]|nr:MAG: DUF2135 domain-containing protein [Balneola sp.]